MYQQEELQKLSKCLVLSSGKVEHFSLSRFFAYVGTSVQRGYAIQAYMGHCYSSAIQVTVTQEHFTVRLYLQILFPQIISITGLN